MALPVANNFTGEKKKIPITLHMDWILYEVMNETFLRGRTIQDRTNHKEIASMFASADDENRQKILRSIKKAYGELRAELSNYLTEYNSASNNKNIDGKSDLTIQLEMPSNFNEAAADPLADECHAFIIWQTVAEWYVVTNSKEAEVYFGLASKSMENVRFNSSQRSRPVAPNNP